ncbi:cupin domain-containing protein [Streptomyces halstedii]|uniref:Cupin domain-containing protein n=1 Tax=Streptomyces halstedii TaxID=1944 RepID=A0ABS6U0Z0_STRHA|nr:cupin domain-containing protein [Streptomyces halstedii]MBV7674206.1 cupin domain-containing protein [Streptomyces halstedii]
MDATQHRKLAGEALAQLSAALLPHWQPTGMRFAHLPSALDAQWTAALPLPRADEVAGPVTLIDGDGADFQREADADTLAREYAARPRTRVMESLHTQSDGWHALTTLHLSRMLRRRVSCSIFESLPQDRTAGRHYDDWDGLIVQVRGAKDWRIGPDPDQANRVTTRPGDVLLLPRGVLHDVTTPQHSVHVLLAITERPLEGHPTPPHQSAA